MHRQILQYFTTYFNTYFKNPGYLSMCLQSLMSAFLTLEVCQQGKCHIISYHIYFHQPTVMRPADSFLKKHQSVNSTKKCQLIWRQLRYNRIVTFFRSSKNTMSIFWSSLCSHMSANISKKLSQPTGNGHAYINIKRAVVQVGLWMFIHDGRAKVGWIFKTSDIFFLNSWKVFMQSYLMFIFFWS